MRTIATNLTTIFWGILYGEVIGYIGSALLQTPFNATIALDVAIVGAIVALVGVNALKIVMKP
ncbi:MULTISPECIES: DUF2929 family protein [Fructilactobacillus]|uniref:YjzD family protein n=1 Tax=Fructilactobacillus carniphilus TaxID=2940297 RepID=A0ABY5BYN0_9LACO|nr:MULTISPECIES: DUF2929 family protein [Fructilactobacillus]USS86608.1 YjzD family protein [Fructilactobacillus cliffordii]USS91043.1 YjzD family protein [Fructilactobacillus carniphilus]